MKISKRPYWHMPLMALLFVLCMAKNGVSMAQAEADNTLRTVLFLHTNDMHAQLMPPAEGKAGMADVAAYIKATKAGRSDVLALDAGDMTVGTPVSTFFNGKPIFEVMNHTGHDLATLGNHEFDNGYAYVADFRQIAQFPIISATMLVRRSELVADAATEIRTVNSVKIGIIGLTTGHAVHNAALTILPPAEAARKHLAELKEKVDIVVALTHLGYAYDLQLAREVPGIDVIIGGHSHTKMEAPEEINGVIVAHGGSNAQYVGELELQVDTRTNRVAGYSGRLVSLPAPGLEPDPEAFAVIQKWETKVSEMVDKQIGKTERAYTVAEMKEQIEKIWLDQFGCDFAHQNKGGTRAPLEAGPITIRDIMQVMPFHNTVVIFTLSREEIRKILPDAVFPQEKEAYTLVTNSYRADRIVEDEDISKDKAEYRMENARQPVIDYIRAHGGLHP